MRKRTLLVILIPLIQFACSERFDSPTLNDSPTVLVQEQSKIGNGTVQISIPVNTSIFNDCTGESVDIVGTDHLIVHQTIQGNNINLNFSENFQSIVGTGEISGDLYSTTSILHNHITAHKGQTVSAQQKLVLTGATTKLTVLMQLHITINADGIVTAFLDEFTSTCELISV
jgi:hypothetical protein